LWTGPNGQNIFHLGRNLYSRRAFHAEKTSISDEEPPCRIYEFCLIGGDGARLRRERRLAADLETVWGLVFRMAEFESERGRQIHVMDDQGRIVIGIGANAATLSAQRLRVLRGRSLGA
jgi:hypothetical protein